MIDDLRIAHKVVFLGVSQRHLHEYLRRLVNAEAPQLQQMDVAFASDQDGVLWEGEAFLSNVRSSRQSISAVMTSEKARKALPRLREIRFWQPDRHSTFGGCLVQDDKDSCLAQYVVNYLPTNDVDTRKSLTFRFDDEDKSCHKAAQAMGIYNESFLYLSHHAKSLGSVNVQDPWNRSAQEWALFTERCTAYNDSMVFLVRKFGVQSRHRVLELGTGTGHPSLILKQRVKRGSLVVLDASPQMLSRAKQVLGMGHVQYALAKIPTDDRVIDLDDTSTYDFIIVHLVLPNMVTTKEDVTSLARWCSHRLEPQGVVVIAAHNTAVRIENDRFDPTTDPLRIKLAQLVRDHPRLGRLYDGGLRAKLEIATIRSAFASAGFRVKTQEEKSFQITMDQRCLMWRTPAVFAALIKSDDVDPADVASIMSQAEGTVRGSDTPDMRVAYLAFSR